MDIYAQTRSQMERWVTIDCARFEFAWKRVLNPETASPWQKYAHATQWRCSPKGQILELLGVKALDDTTLRVELEHHAILRQKLTSGFPSCPQSEGDDCVLLFTADNWVVTVTMC